MTTLFVCQNFKSYTCQLTSTFKVNFQRWVVALPLMSWIFQCQFHRSIILFFSNLTHHTFLTPCYCWDMLNLLGHCPLVATPPSMIPAPALLWPCSAWFVCNHPVSMCSLSTMCLHCIFIQSSPCASRRWLASVRLWSSLFACYIQQIGCFSASN
jgi:hypothetical protein